MAWWPRYSDREVGITTAATLTGRFLAVAGHPGRLVLDLSGLAFVDVVGGWALDDVRTLLQAERPVIVRLPRPRPAASSEPPAW